MTWEIVAMVALLALIFIIVGLFLAAIGNLIADGMTKRRIEMYKAGLTPKGWK